MNRASVDFSGGSEPDWTELTGNLVHNPHGSVQYRWNNDLYYVRFELSMDGNRVVTVSSWRSTVS